MGAKAQFPKINGCHGTHSTRTNITPDMEISKARTSGIIATISKLSHNLDVSEVRRRWQGDVQNLKDSF